MFGQSGYPRDRVDSSHKLSEPFSVVSKLIVSPSPSCSHRHPVLMCASEPPDQDSGSDVGVRRSQKHARSISNASSIHKSLPPLPCLSASSIPRTSLKARVKHSALRADSSSGSIITLHVYSGASSESDCPMFHEGEEIVGSVEMKLMKPASIKEVQVSVCLLSRIENIYVDEHAVCIPGEGCYCWIRETSSTAFR